MPHVRQPGPTTVRARLLLLGIYALVGVMFSSWLARLPTIRDLLDLSTARVGLLLLVGSAGSLVAVAFSGALAQRLGNRCVFVAATVATCAGYALMGLGPAVGSAVLFTVGIFVNGVGGALTTVVVNVESARIERAMGRTVIPQFHAAFSLGAVTGSAAGALASRAGVPVGVQLSAVAAVAVVWRLASLGGVLLPPLPDEVTALAPPAPAGHRHGRASMLGPWRERRTLLVGVVVLAASLSEGAANNWLSLAVVDGFREPESVGGVVLGLFVGAMTLVRALGTRLIDRHGRVVVLRASGLASLVGLLVFCFAPALPLAGAGVVLWGLGAALAVPIGVAAASDDPRRAAGRVSVVMSFSVVASLVAPPVLGLAADSLGARHALVLVVAAMVVSLAVSGEVAPERQPAANGAPAPAKPDTLVTT